MQNMCFCTALKFQCQSATAFIQFNRVCVFVDVFVLWESMCRANGIAFVRAIVRLLCGAAVRFNKLPPTSANSTCGCFRSLRANFVRIYPNQLKVQYTHTHTTQTHKQTRRFYFGIIYNNKFNTNSYCPVDRSDGVCVTFGARTE